MSRVTVEIRFDREAALREISAMVAEYAGQSISPHRMEIIKRRAVEIAQRHMRAEVVPARH